MMKALFAVLVGTLTFHVSPVPLYGGSGVTSDTIHLGMSTVLSGPSAGLGIQMKRGIEAYFAYVNGTGGVHGRKLVLHTLDDGYEPGRTAPNMHQLTQEEGVFAVIGNVGTPTAVVSVPIANEAKVPFFGALTGAALLRHHPPDRYIINFRASYHQEIQTMIDGLVDGVGIPPERIAFFTQNDAYGDAGFSGAKLALEKRGYKHAVRNVHGRYQRNTVNIEDGLERILDARLPPLAVIMVGTYNACSRFINLARREHLNAVFLNLSFVGAERLAESLHQSSEGRVIVTQVVPPPSTELPALRSYREAMGGDYTFNSLEGWLVASAFVEGVRLSGKELDREGFIDVLESGAEIDIGLGVIHKLGRDKHQLSENVWPTIWRDGRWQVLAWKELRATLKQPLNRLKLR